MQCEPEEENEPPDGYTFLLAAGEFDNFRRGDFKSAEKCGKELVRISRMNGTYRKLPRSFRCDMRLALEQSCDRETAKKLGELGAALLRSCELDESNRQVVRDKCSALSRFWPMEPRILLIHTKAKVPD